MTRSLRWAISLAILLTAAGCAQTASSSGGDPVPAFGPDDLVLQVGYFGGFRPPSPTDDIPAVSVYGDGRVITLGPQIEIYPPPALPNIQVATISQANLGGLWDRAMNARVGEKADFGQPPVADAMSTRIRLRTENGLVTTEVYALNEAVSEGMTADQKANRDRMLDLVHALTDLRKTLGDSAVSKEQAYQASTVAVMAWPWSADPNGSQPEKAWPGPELPGQPMPNSMFGCATVTGDQVTTVLDAAAKANKMTPWTSGGKKWLVQFRPLLPHESSCADLNP